MRPPPGRAPTRDAQSQYTGSFESAGVTVHDLKELTNTQLKEIVPTAGHCRRLVLALQELNSSSGASSSSFRQDSKASDSHQVQLKYNSTSSMYIDSTISKPCIDEMIFCVSIVIHDRIEEGERALADDPSIAHVMPSMFDTASKPLLKQLDSSDPTEDTIFESIKAIYSIAEFSAECLVISLLYIERLRSLTGLHLFLSNWQPVLLAAMVVAQKVWDDKSLLNVDFTLICSNYSLRDINQLEKAFLEMLQYNVSITTSLYASYYFELRTLCEREQRSFTLKPLTEEQQRALELRAETKTQMLAQHVARPKSLGTNLGQDPERTPKL